VRVCVVTSSYPRFQGDGTAPFVRSICEHLAELGHEVHVLAPYDPEVRGGYRSSVQVHRFRYVWADDLCIMGHAKSLEGDVKLKRIAYFLIPLYLLFGLLSLLRLTGQYKFDVIHAHWVIPSGPIAAAVAGIRRTPLIVSLHGSDIFIARKNPLFGLVASMTLRFAQVVTACSDDLKADAIRLGVPKSTIRTIVWGADPKLFVPRNDAALRASLGISSNDLVVLGLGRLVHKKGYQYLLRAIPHVLGEFEKVKFVIGGAGSVLDELKQLARELGVENRVSFPGRVAWYDVPTYLSMCDVFVAPSIRDHQGNVDGLPTTILEAMAAGKPVVASNIGGIPLVVKDGENGFLVEEKDSLQIAGAIKQLLVSESVRECQGAANREKVERELNWGRVAWTFVQLYEAAGGKA
jgi:glycosyltransferase involved in cell wall biosynthesis